MSDFNITINDQPSNELNFEICGDLTTKQYDEIINYFIAKRNEQLFPEFKEFLEKHDLILSRGHSVLTGKITYSIKHAEFKRYYSSKVLRRAIGYGVTEHNAIQTLVAMLSNAVLVINASSSTQRRDIKVPDFISHQ